MSESSFKISVITSCFKGELYLNSFIDQLKSQSVFPDLEWIFVHNEPSRHEIELINSFSEEFPGKIKHIIRDSVEPLSVSWNRGWKIAKTDYICFWNVDDCRPGDSLQRQVEILEENPDYALAYGDFIEVTKYGSISGKSIKTIPYNTFLIQRKFPGGAFMVWRRNTSDRVGYFDEQLQIACDYELVVRAAVLGLKMGKTQGVVGYFTNESIGLSTMKGANREVVERKFVQLRYGMFDKISSEHIAGLESYRILEILNDEKWVPVSFFVKEYASFIKQRLFLKKFAGLRSFLMNLFGEAR